MKTTFQIAERLIWVLSGIICLWGAWDTHRRGGSPEWVFILLVIGVAFLAYTFYHIRRREHE